MLYYLIPLVIFYLPYFFIFSYILFNSDIASLDKSWLELSGWRSFANGLYQFLDLFKLEYISEVIPNRFIRSFPLWFKRTYIISASLDTKILLVFSLLKKLYVLANSLNPFQVAKEYSFIPNIVFISYIAFNKQPFYLFFNSYIIVL